MSLLKSNKGFTFRSFGGVEPTTIQLREELEDMYKYLAARIAELDKAVEARITVIEDETP